VNGKKKLRGILMGVSDGMVTLLVNEETVSIPFPEIIRARLVNYNGEDGC
jgi:ribosome maturation factor RimP